MWEWGGGGIVVRHVLGCVGAFWVDFVLRSIADLTFVVARMRMLGLPKTRAISFAISSFTRVLWSTGDAIRIKIVRSCFCTFPATIRKGLFRKESGSRAA